MLESLAPRMAQLCQELEFSVSAEQQRALLHYLSLLAKWNKTYNLTAVRDPQAMLVQHLMDGLVILPFLRAGRLLDMGSGAGLPGIPLAIMQPERVITLLDSNVKKTRFMQQAVAELGLSRVTVEHRRVEDYSPEQCFDTVTGRAFTQLERLVALAQPLLCDTGVVQAMKGPGALQEQESLPSSWRVVHQCLRVPGMPAERYLVTVNR